MHGTPEKEAQQEVKWLSQIKDSNEAVRIEQLCDTFSDAVAFGVDNKQKDEELHITRVKE